MVVMTLRELLHDLQQKNLNGTNMDSEIYVKVGREYRTVTTSYTNGTFILVAGPPVKR